MTGIKATAIGTLLGLAMALFWVLWADQISLLGGLYIASPGTLLGLIYAWLRRNNA